MVVSEFEGPWDRLAKFSKKFYDFREVLSESGGMRKGFATLVG